MDEVFGRYRLIEVIGEGSMGTVYRADDTVIGREVALKVLPTDLASEPGYRERFRREAQAAARLNEPHIVAIYDTGEIDDRLYLTMPIIDGIDLQNLLKHGGAMPPQRAVKVIEQIALALDAAHAAGLVHRDVKPSNALMAANEFVYLIDFGIAHEASATKLTSTGSVVGTFAYMAPERFSTGIADARADVYALACVLHECLTGLQPFPGDSLEQQVAGHLTRDAPRPSAVNPAVPAGFDEVIARGMAKDPDQRYQTARQLATAAAHALTAAPAPSQAGPGPAHALTAAPAPSQAGPGPGPWPSVGHLGPDPDSAPQPIVPAGGLAPSLPAPVQPFAPAGSAWPGGPATPRVSRKRWIIVAASAAAVVVAVGVGAAIVGLGRSTPTAHQTSSTSPPTVGPDRLDSILLSAEDVSTLMGVPGIQLDGQIRRGLRASTGTLSNPDCLGSMMIAQQLVYEGSGYIATSYELLSGQKSAEHAEQLVLAAVSFPSADLALAFVKNSAPKWRACAGQTITWTQSSGPEVWTVGDLTGDVPTIALLRTLGGGRGMACQRVLSAVGNLVIDVGACGYQISDQGRRIADKMAAKVTQ